MTYSLIARDAASGEMGIATQSYAFAVGSSVPWAAPGWGVIATQSVGEPFYGELGLDLLDGGLDAHEALRALQGIDPHPERRQVAMMDASGAIAVYTGDGCIPAAGHDQGDDWCVLANMVASADVWAAMAETFTATSGTLGHRMAAALRAAEGQGGDIRGARSAAITVVRSVRTGRPWRDHQVDLRVDDHADPVGELSRLVAECDRYHRGVRAFERAIDGDPAGAVGELAELTDMEDDPGRSADLVLWHALALTIADETEDAARLLARAAEQSPHLLEVFARFGPDSLPIGEGQSARVVAGARAHLAR